MAASSSSLSSTFTRLTLRSPTAPLLSPFTTFLKSPSQKPLKFHSLRVQSKPPSEAETIFFENESDPDQDFSFEPPTRPDDFIEPPSFDSTPLESEEDIALAYEELYGPAYSGVSVLGNDVYVMDAKVKKKVGLGGNVKKEKVRDGFEERVVQVSRVTKVVKGGKQLHFRAVVVVGDKQGQVGVGVGKAKEVIGAVQKSALNARRNIVSVPMTKYSTFPHRYGENVWI